MPIPLYMLFGNLSWRMGDLPHGKHSRVVFLIMSINGFLVFEREWMQKFTRKECYKAIHSSFVRSDSFRRRLQWEALRLPFLKGMAPSPLAKARCEVAKLSWKQIKSKLNIYKGKTRR